MNIAFFYENVLPARGGCETYIADLARRLLHDRHEVHLYACRWDEAALPPGMHYHPIEPVGGFRFLRPWRFARRCLKAAVGNRHDVTLGFDKTFGQDVLYPQGGLHKACAAHNLDKFSAPLMRGLVRVLKWFDLAHWSFSRLEKKQYLHLAPAATHQFLASPRPIVIVNSFMVRDHFRQYYGIGPENLRVVRSAIDPGRFPEQDRPKRRQEHRDQWGITPEETVGLLAAMNYRLKGLGPLLRGVQRAVTDPIFNGRKPRFKLLVAGNPKFGRYQRLARRLGIADHVVFAGHCPDIRNAYFAADFLVHPTFYDPCSLVVLEALACGLPVITTRSNGASELMKPLQEGFVIDDPHDTGRLAWALLQLMDPARRSLCSQAARRTAASWTFEHHYQQLLEVFREVAKKKLAA